MEIDQYSQVLKTPPRKPEARMAEIVRNIAFWVIILIALLENAAGKEPLRIGIPDFPTEQASPFSSFTIPAALPLDSVFDTLTVIDEEGDTMPGLAISWEELDPTTWLFKLRKGVTFSNGKEFTAAAVVSTIDTLLSKEGGQTSLGTTLRRIGLEKAIELNHASVKFILKKPDVLFPQYMSTLRIPEPTSIKADSDNYPIGTGPYIIKTWRQGTITLTANESSWRKPIEKQIEIIQLPDASSRTQGAISGSLDIAFGLSSDDIKPIEKAGGSMWIRKEPGAHFLAFVTVKESPVQDVRVRRALNHGVNKERIINAFLDSKVSPNSQIAHSMSFGYNRSLEPYEFNPTLARKLLKQAGYENGFELPTLFKAGGAGNSQDWYQQIAADLHNISVKVTLKPARLSSYFEYMYNGGWPALAFGMSTYTFDPLAAYRIRSCEWKHPYHCDLGIMPLISAARAARTLDQRNKLTQAVLEYEYKNPPGIFMWQAISFEGIGEKVASYRSYADTIEIEKISLRP